MSRLMSVSLTEDAVRARRKTVTRRLGWRFLKPGDRLTLCRKVMGRKPDEPLVRIAEVEVTDVRRERLWMLDEDDIARECVPDFGQFTERYTDTGKPTEQAWIAWFCEHMGCKPHDDITRIEWRYLDEAEMSA